MKNIMFNIYKIFVYYVPICVVFIAGIYAGVHFLRSPLAFEQGRLFFGLDITTATLAGLSFYASYASMDETRKVSYYASAENFFHAMVLFIFVTFLQEVITRLEAFLLQAWLLRSIVFILGISVVACFYFAFKHFLIGMFGLMKIFHFFSVNQDDGKNK